MFKNRELGLVLLGVLVITVSLFYLTNFKPTKVVTGSEQNLSEQNRQPQVIKPGGKQFAVSAANPLAVKAGMAVLRQGGNAVDAAIAVSYVLGVVHPFASGIGGGGVMLVYPTDKQKPVVYDYETISPSSGAITERFVGVPGFVRAMEQIHADYGTVDLRQLIEPAINAAENGFNVDKVFNSALVSQRYKLTGKESLAEFFPQGQPLKVGTMLKQPVLADTLREIQRDGSKAFYQGSIAESILQDVSGISKSDLNNYQITKREPVTGKYYGYDIFSAPPPYSGITLIQIMELAEKLKVDSLMQTENNVRLYSDIVNEAYSRRSKDIADPAYMKVDYNTLLNPDYLEEMMRDISAGAPSERDTQDEETEETTHFVVIDQDGMMVSSTNSLSSWFGSGIYTRGFFLNNHLSNLNQNQNSVNGWDAGKHPRSFISPTIIAQNGKPILGIGTPGGRKIPMMISQVLFKILNDKKPPQQAIDEPRFFLLQNNIYTEGDIFSAEVKKVLNSKGYGVIAYNHPLSFGAVNGLYFDPATEKISGGADVRRGGTWELEASAN